MPIRRGALTTREGGGLVNLPAADNPLVFVKPSAVSLGLLRVGTTRRVPVDVTDAGGGAAPWSVSLRLQGSPGGVKLTVPPRSACPAASRWSLKQSRRPPSRI